MKNNLKVAFARIISFIMQPVFVLLPLPYLLVQRTRHDQLLSLKWTLLSILFIITASVIVLTGIKAKIFSDLSISKREERPALFLVLGLIVSSYIITLIVLQAPPILLLAGFGLLLGLFAVSLVNRWVKASGHVATASAFVVAIGIGYGASYLLGFSIVILTAWSRVVLKKHKVSETIAGGILGIVATVIVYGLGRFYLAYVH